MDRIHKIHSIAGDTSERILVVQEETDKNFKRQLDQIMSGLKRGPGLEKPLREEKNTSGQLKSPNWTMPEV